MSTIIKLENVSMHFDTQLLYSDVNLKIMAGEKVLICGENGCGKSTLIRLILGELAPEQGTITLDPHLSIAYLKQFETVSGDGTVEEYIEKTFQYIYSIERQIRDLEARFAEEYSEAIANEYERLLTRFEEAGGYKYLKKKDEFLHVFGLERLMDRKVATLSGGEKQYLRLASTIFSDASLLILDEPFTFLDKGKIAWLLNYLHGTEKTVMVISHDFHLAKEFATSVVSIQNWQVKKYQNDYTSFLSESAEEDARHKQANTTADNFISKKEVSIAKKKEWLKRAENKHHHAVVIRRLEREAAKLEKDKYVYKEVKKFDVQTMVKQDSIKSGEQLITLQNVSMQYGKNRILDQVSLSFYSNKHYLILGENGAGKSTLMNLIMQWLMPTAGRVFHARKIAFASLDQWDEKVTPNLTALDVLSTVSGNSRSDWISQYSRYFDVQFWDKKLSCLSGGELRRLFIFKCLLTEFDVLMLDEPTTFVDEEVRSGIIQMLNVCPKCVVVVTHDQELYENMAGLKFIIQNGKLISETEF